MKTSGTIAVGAGGAVVGLLLGLVLGGSGDSGEEDRARMQEELAGQMTALSEKIDGLEGNFASLSEEVSSIGSGVGEHSEMVAELQSRIGEIGSSVSGAVSGLSSELNETVSGLSNDLSGRISEQFSGLSSQIAAFRVEETTGEDVSGELVRPGETLIIGEGAARIFLSAVSQDNQSARIAIDGTGVQTISLGRPVSSGGCDITLTAIQPPSAMIDAVCDGGSGDQAASSEPPGLGEGTELQVSRVASFGDGAVKVFLSQFDASAGTARLAINGTDTTVLAVGESADADGCAVTLTGMSDSAISINADC
ncbi:hypothetical protein [Amaricoccus macauensis]|uniref:hypothetical protein n=1 Tax=Amaricoccus macauensis TaxID=57001 RepID=UPI003C79C7AD